MDNNKKKALIKSVAAFTFAVSMFAAQSPAVSAQEAEALTTDVAGASVLSEDEDEDEVSQYEESGDDVGDDIPSQNIIPEVSEDLTNSNGTVIGETYVDSGFYNPDAELGIANNFHIFTNGTVQNDAHINGNIAAGKIGTDKNFGTNNLLEGDITYAESFDTGINRGGSTNPTIILGSDNTIEEANNGLGCEVTSPDGGSFTENDKANIFIEDEGTKYIDLDGEMAVYSGLSDTLSQYTSTETDYDLSDMNNAFIVINDDGLSVVNITATIVPVGISVTIDVTKLNLSEIIMPLLENLGLNQENLSQGINGLLTVLLEICYGLHIYYTSAENGVTAVCLPLQYLR